MRFVREGTNGSAWSRFWAKVHLGTSRECWEWTAALRDGYGQFRIGGVGSQNLGAHRVAYEWLIGRVPDGRQLDHLCRNRRCVNPLHLEAVSSRENTMRGVGVARQNVQKAHCPAGHRYDEANTLVWRARRICKACRYPASRQFNRRRRAEARS